MAAFGTLATIERMNPFSKLHRHPEETEIAPPVSWSGESGKPRILIENPDGAELWAHGDVLREAGYEYAVCRGPSLGLEPETYDVLAYYDEPIVTERVPAHSCPLLTGGRCPLAEEADVVITSTRVPDCEALVAAHRALGVAALVVEVEGGPKVEQPAGVTVLESPITKARLLAAIETALSR
jgi:hypothetical protein